MNLGNSVEPEFDLFWRPDLWAKGLLERLFSKVFAVLFRKRSDTTMGIANGVNRFAGREELAADLVNNFIAKNDHSTFELLHRGPQQEQIIVTGRGFVSAMGVRHPEVDPFLLFHFAIGETHGTTPFRSSYFKPDQIVCVVRDAHLVSLSVTDTNFSFDREG